MTQQLKTIPNIAVGNLPPPGGIPPGPPIIDKSSKTKNLLLPEILSKFSLNSKSSNASLNNPFRLPLGEEWLTIRRRYAAELQEQRTQDRIEPEIHKKHTFRSRHTGKALPRLRKLLKNYDHEVAEQVKQADMSDIEKAFEVVKKKNPYWKVLKILL